ncbi:peptidase M3 [Marinitoga sp. 1135]|uniref:Oligoendopeptidase F n=1 Tax=Marinitoga piezophila (strain DSM 14283 / JCM 11233 / KA3) TaxID=443254 RepID=H2J5C0_MARPK|nr:MULTISPECIES: M3 family oligoendopeptidase [Marinitoga]AEX84978.1 oligoendopeptidase F [Marinitoga piezophila KA3]NUU95209.1 peptidase M3 [Marinitoga sp. 1135]NUU97141.1 peptidase M3 [Marinitoga sp. 1138]
MKWDLTFFYDSPENEQIKKDFENALEGAKKLKEKYYPILSSKELSAKEVKNFLEELEKLIEKPYFAMQYASLLYSANTQDKTAQKLVAMGQDYLTKGEMELSFWKPVLLSHSLEKLEELKNSPELEKYKHVLEVLIEEKPHVLSEDAEKALSALEPAGRRAFSKLYEKLVSSYTFEIEIDGELKTMTGAEIRSLRQHPDKDLRQKAMKMFFERYEKDKIILESTFNSVAKYYDTESKLRNYPEPISMRNMANEVKDEIVKMVIDVTTEQTPIVHKYYKWKRDFLGYDITLADIYAPLKPVKKEISFEDAKKLVLDAYYEFDKEIGDIVKSFFDENRIDSEIQPGKRGGAFCSYNIPNYKPFILLNYTGNMRDVMTLAHELGHGVHGTLSSKQSLLNYHTPLTMAEVASVFGEMLVMDKLLKELEGEEKQMFIASKIEDMFATMFRQNMFARFEIQSHKMIDENGMASWEELSELYEKELKIMFGDSVKIPEEYKYEWSTIPHMLAVPFYVYAYNFANLLVIALYEKYLEEGKAFIPKYKELLSSGGNAAPEKLLEKLDIDITKKEFWEKGFKYIERELINKL